MQLNSRDAALLIMRADMETGKATSRSLGVMYAFVMAGSSCDGPDFWGPINKAILEYKSFSFLESVKKVAWKVYEEASSKTAGVTGPIEVAQ